MKMCVHLLGQKGEKWKILSSPYGMISMSGSKGGHALQKMLEHKGIWARWHLITRWRLICQPLDCFLVFCKDNTFALCGHSDRYYKIVAIYCWFMSNCLILRIFFLIEVCLTGARFKDLESVTRSWPWRPLLVARGGRAGWLTPL